MFKAFDKPQDIIASTICVPGLEVFNELSPRDVLFGLDVFLGAE